MRASRARLSFWLLASHARFGGCVCVRWQAQTGLKPAHLSSRCAMVAWSPRA